MSTILLVHIPVIYLRVGFSTVMFDGYSALLALAFPLDYENQSFSDP